MIVAKIGTLAAGGIVLGLALLACAVMLLAFRVQRRRGRWNREVDAESNGHRQD